MRNLPKLAFLFIVLLSSTFALGQVSLSPTFATQNDTVTITYDATGGSGGLVGVSPVYIHSGVITDQSTSPSDWRYVQGTWGVADARVRMTDMGNNRHQIKIHIPTFYNVPAGENIQSLAMVFRNATGSQEGKTATGGDFFLPLYGSGLQATFVQPQAAFGIYELSDSIDIHIQSSQAVTLRLFHNSTLLATQTNADSLFYRLQLSTFGAGNFDLHLEAQSGSTIVRDTVSYLARGTTPVLAESRSVEEGITRIDPTTLYFKLRAPQKTFAYLIGDFNNWTLDADYDMYQTPDGEYFWLELDSLDPSATYRFQYFVGPEGIRIADPYSELILDPWNDQWIPASTYPNLPAYPAGKTQFPVTAYDMDALVYQWDTSFSYERPPAENLMVYELLIRDFDAQRTYQSVIERLPYLDSLGINAIELMPIMEFEGNESWGYNPMFFLAPDKYYGTQNDFKALVDSCHKRGIAVILDLVLNHAFGQSPLARLYFENGAPTANSPYFNQVAKHEFNVGYDFNHEAPATQYHSQRVLQHWLREYKIDGYRLDLSKGLTQKNTLGSVAQWNQYDASRIAILKGYRDDVYAVDPEAYIILEHFADLSEERELAQEGFMLWGNENHQYNEATMGFQSNLSGAYYDSRGFDGPSVITYMESHDEERLMYRNLNFGNTSGNYSTRTRPEALDRMAAATAFFLTIPGPKMIWQFGEMGYDYSINRCTDGSISEGCRLSNKPIRWDYLTEPDRVDLFQTYSKLFRLRRAHPSLFTPDSLFLELGIPNKQIVLQKGDSSLVAIGNFNIADREIAFRLPNSGWWFDLISGDSTLITDTIQSRTLQPGDFMVWTNFDPKLNPVEVVDTTPVDTLQPRPVDSTAYGNMVSFYPNPTNDQVELFLFLPTGGKCTLQLFTSTGKLVAEKRYYQLKAGLNHLPFGGLKSDYGMGPGLYYYRAISLNRSEGGSLILTE